MKKILIFYASYGGGHLSAAKSIKECLENNYTNIQIEMVDCIRYTNKFLDKLTTGAYKKMAKDAPKLWGKVYSKSQKGILSGISKCSNKLMAKKLYKLIKKIDPEIIISTHPFSTQMVSYLKRKKLLECKLATILTDFSMHTQWLVGNEYGDLFFVSNDKMQEQLVKYGVKKEKIHVTGIPLSKRFKEKFDKEKIYEMFNLDKNKKTILFFGGGEFGLGKTRTILILKSIIKYTKDYQIVVISGKNEKLKNHFEELVKEAQAEKRVKVLGYTNNVPELMSISYVVVTKPGGLTTSETLASGLPMIIINPIPGQEEENAHFLEEREAGIWIKKNDNIDEVVANIFNSEEKIEKLAEGVKKISKKHSTEDICKIVMENL